MATVLSNVQEIIERSIFESIRLELVSQGYLPNVANTTLYPNNQTGWNQWEQAIKDIKASSKGFAIELFSGGNSQSRGAKKTPRVVMDPGSFLPGALGGDPRRVFSDQGTTYKALVTPPQTVDFYMDIIIVCDSIAQQRIINAILALSVPRRGYMKWYNDTTKTFFIRHLNYYDNHNPTDGFIEYIYSYEIPDAWDREDLEVYSSVAKIEEIEFHTNIQKYMNGTWGYDADSLIVN